MAARTGAATSKSISATHAASTSGPYSDHFTVRRARSRSTSTWSKALSTAVTSAQASKGLTAGPQISTFHIGLSTNMESIRAMTTVLDDDRLDETFAALANDTRRAIL